jgi:hypothetical protein
LFRGGDVTTGEVWLLPARSTRSPRQNGSALTVTIDSA